MFYRMFIALIFAAFSHSLVSDEASDQEEKLAEAFANLDWNGPGAYSLSHSHTSIEVPEGYYVVLGDDAKKERALAGESDERLIDAVVYSKDFQECVIFEFNKDGYVSMDDWDQLDSKALLKSIKEGTEEANADRSKLGITPIHALGWVQEPILDRKDNVVYWAFDLQEQNGDVFANVVALKFGLNGYEKVTWVTSGKEAYVHGKGMLDKLLSAHEYDKGHRYSDFKAGDKVAAFGVATLVAATVGGKLLQGGFLFGIKKFLVFAFTAVAAVFYKLKNYFKKK